MTKKRHGRKNAQHKANPGTTTQPRARKPRGKHPKPRLTGSGDYRFSELGTYYGGRLGAGLGRTAGRYVDRLVGNGDYVLKKNSIMPASSGVPSFSTSRHSHRVAISDFAFNLVSGSANSFSVQSADIRVDNVYLFNTLSQLAKNYTEWKLHGLVIEYRPISGDALSSTNTTLGKVVIATQYNPYAPAFTSTREMEAYQFNTSCKPSVAMLHPVECAPSESLTSLFSTSTNSNILSTTTGDKRFTQPGTLYFASEGVQGANVVLGEIWAHAEVELLKPRLYASLGYGLQCIRWNSNTSAVATVPFSLTNNATYRNSFFDYATTSNTLGLINVTTGLALTNGIFRITGFYQGSATAPVFGTFSLTGGWSYVITSSGHTMNHGYTSAASFFIAFDVIVTISSPGTISWTGLTLPTGTGSWELSCDMLPPDYASTV